MIDLIVSWYTGLNETVFQIVIFIFFTVALLLMTKYGWLLPTDSGRENPGSGNVTAFTICESPDCVRCSTYRQLEDQLLPKLEEYAREFSWDGLERILSAIEEADIHRSNQEVSLQQPNVYFMPELLADPWYNITRTQDVQLLKENFNEISSDFKNVYAEFKGGDTIGWLTNNVPTGEWFVFHLINQGKRIQDNCRKCPNTVTVLDQLENIMDINVFGNATFSVLQPGTHITEHYGPTNLRIRCHLGLTIPPNCHLTVAGETRQWTEGDCITFDDSFLHEAKHDGKSEDGPRILFMVDMWHPDVTQLERNVLNYLFSPNH